MARRSARKSSARSSRRPVASAPGSDRDKIIAAFLELLAAKRIEQIGFAEIAEASGVPFPQLRNEFASTLAILAAHIKSVDRAVLSADLTDVEEEPPRERLFDVLMRRLEILAGISASGPRGMLRAQGLAALFGGVLRTWIDDEDPGLARTMAALDRALGRGQRFAGLLDDLCRIPARLCRLRPRRRRRDGDYEDTAAAA
jgi:AcrR family transcriptional regulator